jgi:hypothetical protein
MIDDPLPAADATDDVVRLAAPGAAISGRKIRMTGLG